MEQDRVKEQRAGGWRAWFQISALVFGSYCGANMASGVYATSYIVPFGGGWMWIFLAIFVAFMSLFCVLSLDFIRAYRVNNYSSFYVALWGADRPGTPPLFRHAVILFFDIYTTLSSLITVASIIALFAELLCAMVPVPTWTASLIAVVVMTALSMHGAEFLLRFNSGKTIALIVSLGVILICVITRSGDVLAARLLDLKGGMDWSGSTLAAQMAMLVSYCFSTASWGGSLSNYAGKIRTRQDAVCSGILMGVMVGVLFLITGLIVLPYMPEAMVDAPILAVCTNYMPGWVTALYWAIAMFSIVTIGPTFIYSSANRFERVWRTERVPHRVRILTVALVFLAMCLALSRLGLIALCQKGYTAMGNIAIVAIAVPLAVSVVRVRRKDRMEQ